MKSSEIYHKSIMIYIDIRFGLKNRETFQRKDKNNSYKIKWNINKIAKLLIIFIILIILKTKYIKLISQSLLLFL